MPTKCQNSKSKPKVQLENKEVTSRDWSGSLFSMDHNDNNHSKPSFMRLNASKKYIFKRQIIKILQNRENFGMHNT